MLKIPSNTQWADLVSRIKEKANSSDLPTKVSDLTNDAGYQTAANVSEAVAGAVGDISGLEYQVVIQLPETGTKGTIYLVSISGVSPNVYAEYIWVNNAWEQIGTTEVDLSGYATTEALNAGLAEKASVADLATKADVATTYTKTEVDAAIAAKGSMKELTEADYNWNSTAGAATEPYNCIAPWLLPEGAYVFNEAQVVIYPYANQTRYNDVDWMIAGPIPTTGNREAEIQLGSSFYRLSMSYSNGSISSVNAIALLGTGDVVNNLTSTSTKAPLSANQGKVLNEKIGDLSTLTTTDQTSAVAAINEIVSKIGDIESALNTINNGGNA